MASSTWQQVYLEKTSPIVGMSINDWAYKFSNTYHKKDLYRRPEHMWTSTMAHLSVVGEEIRKFDYNEILYASTNAFCWMCSYVTKCINTDDLIFKITNTFPE